MKKSLHKKQYNELVLHMKISDILQQDSIPNFLYTCSSESCMILGKLDLFWQHILF